MIKAGLSNWGSPLHFPSRGPLTVALLRTVNHPALPRQLVQGGNFQSRRKHTFFWGLCCTFQYIVGMCIQWERGDSRDTLVLQKHGKYKNWTHSSSSSHILGRSQRSRITKNATCRPSHHSSYSAELSRMTKVLKFKGYERCIQRCVRRFDPSSRSPTDFFLTSSELGSYEEQN